MNYCSLDPGVPACAPLPWLRRSLASWLAAGVPRAKLVPILPWCARCCSGAATARERLARPGKIIAMTLAADKCELLCAASQVWPGVPRL